MVNRLTEEVGKRLGRIRRFSFLPLKPSQAGASVSLVPCRFRRFPQIFFFHLGFTQIFFLPQISQIPADFFSPWFNLWCVFFSPQIYTDFFLPQISQIFLEVYFILAGASVPLVSLRFFFATVRSAKISPIRVISVLLINFFSPADFAD